MPSRSDCFSKGHKNSRDFAIEETADSEEDDETSDDEGPDIRDARGGGDDEVVGNEALGGELIVDDVPLGCAYAAVEYPAWHNEFILKGHHRGQKFVAAVFLVHHPFQFFIVVKE